MSWFFFIVTMLGVLLTCMGAYNKRQMVLSDLGNPQARQYIDHLTQKANGDFPKVFRINQEVLVWGILTTIGGGVGFIACISR